MEQRTESSEVKTSACIWVQKSHPLAVGGGDCLASVLIAAVAAAPNSSPSVFMGGSRLLFRAPLSGHLGGSVG